MANIIFGKMEISYFLLFPFVNPIDLDTTRASCCFMKIDYGNLWVYSMHKNTIFASLGSL